jgi:Skp family chaperone for outer membrane proteins
MKRFAIAASLVLASSVPALAQTAPAAEAFGGPVVPGVCLLSKQAVVENAKAGVAATARLRQLTDQAKSEIDAERTTLGADAKALEAQRASLKPAEAQQRTQALNVRIQTLQDKVNQRNREIEVTREKALNRIAGEMQPVILAAYKAHNCGLLADRNAMFGGNMANDLTAAVVQGLDARMATITFERETLPAAPPAR